MLFRSSLFRTGDGRDRFGIAALQPGTLRDLPVFRGDAIDPARSAGDLCVQVCAASAADAEAILAGLGIDRVDHVLSGLPLSSLPTAVSDAILTGTARLLGEHGRFILFQYSRYRRAMIARHFRHITSRHVLANLPPAYVFACDNRPD